MIVNIDYEDCKGTSLKVVQDDKEVNGYMRIRVTRDNIKEAVDKYDSNPRAVAFNFMPIDLVEDMKFLAEVFPNKLQSPILYTVDISSMDKSDITLSYLEDYFHNMPQSVRLVFKCAKDFCDMSVIWTLSQKYGCQVAFCGGYFLNAPNCSIGCVRACDVKGRAFGNQAATVKGCGCVMQNIAFDDAEIIWETGAVKQPKNPVAKQKSVSEKAQSKPKAKKQTTTLFSLMEDGMSAF